ncbi:MAG: NAD+ synthase [Alphaproteobacteria bacterium]
MTQRLTIALAQLNPVMGAITENLAKLSDIRAQAAKAGAELVLTPELYACGYPPEDLVLKPFFVDHVRDEVEAFAATTADGGPAVLLGLPWRDETGLFNAVAMIEGGKITAIRKKHHLPNYQVFDEKRVFDSGPLPAPIEFKGLRLAVPICEDIWFDDVCKHLADQGADIILSPNGSPFTDVKHKTRREVVTARVDETFLPLVYLNQVCGQDDLVFDGGSFVMDKANRVTHEMKHFAEDLVIVEFTRDRDGWWPRGEVTCERPDRYGEIYAAMMLGLKDYVTKNGFPGVIIGMSGGVDSALTAAVAVDALGAENVHLVMMPSPYTSDHSLEDAADCAKRLEAHIDSISIEPAMKAFEGSLNPFFEGVAEDVTEENIQSRARGVLLMALSNKFGKMVLTTGNKSEVAVGYATLYGDMCGGYSVLKDVYKTDVFALCDWRNDNHLDGALGPAGEVITPRIITKPPSAELRPDQKDEDSLPPYDVLDDILYCLVEQEMDLSEIEDRGHDRQTIVDVWKLLDRAEYKRRQSPPGVKIGLKAFTRERRYPITNRFNNVAASADAREAAAKAEQKGEAA